MAGGLAELLPVRISIPAATAAPAAATFVAVPACIPFVTVSPKRAPAAAPAPATGDVHSGPGAGKPPSPSAGCRPNVGVTRRPARRRSSAACAIAWISCARPVAWLSLECNVVHRSVNERQDRSRRVITISDRWSIRRTGALLAGSICYVSNRKAKTMGGPPGCRRQDQKLRVLPPGLIRRLSALPFLMLFAFSLPLC